MIKDLSDNHLFNNYQCGADDANIKLLRQQLASLKAELKAIGEAINDPRTDMTMTMSEVIVEQKQQLAAALAAIKVKDEALNAIATTGAIREAKWCGMSARDIAESALAIQPDDSALKAWLGEPVAWVPYEYFTAFSKQGFEIVTHKIVPNLVPLYSPKGMTK